MTTEIVISRGNLPAEPNSFVGRERDLEELAQLLSAVRALTLCGPGGIGKTRLALRLAQEMVPSFPDGTWLIELADTADPGLLPGRIASALGIREEPDSPLAETLIEALRPRQLLLVLDTCEHIVDACAALVQQLLAGCAQLRLIATSREPLRVRGETVWRVPPLAVPAAAAGLSVSQLAEHEAIRLFAERAAAVSPGFTLSADNAEAVARLCQMLDGMPLAIELAAARVRALSIEQIVVRVADRFRLLATGDRTAPLRQQTLRAAVDWSYELLTEPEQILLRRLSVFAGWNLEMAEEVCADEAIPAGQVLDLLAALIDKSLVTLDSELDGHARYRLLDTIKEYAADRLASSGEGPAIRRRHSAYMLRLLEATVARAFVRGDPPWPERVAMYRRITMERPNYRAALAACQDRGDAQEGLRLCCALRSQWIADGAVTEGSGWFDLFLGLAGEVEPIVRARALMLRAELAFEQQDYTGAGECARAGLELCRAAGGNQTAGGLRMLALVSLRAGRPEEALASADAAVEAARAAADDWEEGITLSTRAAVLARQGKPTEAQRTFEAALAVLADNNGWGLAQTWYGLGSLARARGDYAAAAGHFSSALARYRQIGARPEIARCLAGLAWVALAEHDLGLAATSLAECLQLSLATGQRLAIARGIQAAAVLAALRDQPARTARLEGAARALLEALGHALSASAQARSDQLLEAARRRLGEATVARLLAEGGAMAADQAVRRAIGADDISLDGHPGGASAAADAAAVEPAVPGTAQADQRPGPDRQPPPPGGQPAHQQGGQPAHQQPGGSAHQQGGQPAHQGGLRAGNGSASGPPERAPSWPARPGHGGDRAAGAPRPAPGSSVLTAREREIVVLIARGLSNRGIADELVISPATAARHVANIFTKLGLRSRAQVAAWVMEAQQRGLS
jgi:predicted ATPase/DNA-binding CsgD family transcriptional regulator